MLRHGSFHHISPKILDIKGVSVVAVVGRGRNIDGFVYRGSRFKHLEPKYDILSGIDFWSPEAKKFVNGTVGALWIPISVKALYADLQTALSNYTKELLKDRDRISNLERGLTLVTTSESESELSARRGFDKREISYLDKFIPGVEVKK